GRIEFDHVPFRLRELIGQSSRTLEASAKAKGLGFEWSVSADVPEVVVGDPGRLAQVLINLIGNGVKFTHSGWVRLDVRTARVTDRSVRLRFRVEDTGIGVPREKHALIFEAFTQADGSVTRRYGGTGLGLAISAKLVQLMDGSIGLESEPGRGSVFEFTAQ